MRALRFLRGHRRVAAAVLVGLTAAPVAAISAYGYGTPLACTGRSVDKPFAAWGDTNNYFQVSNGDFETSGLDWIGSNASLVSENEPWKVGGSTDYRSLRLGPSGTAESRTLCVTRGEDTVRFFVKNPKVWGAYLHVEVIARNPNTGYVGVKSFDVSSDLTQSGWSPVARIAIPDLLGSGSSQDVTVKFTAKGTWATWGVDDVYVDPWKL